MLTALLIITISFELDGPCLEMTRYEARLCTLGDGKNAYKRRRIWEFFYRIKGQNCIRHSEDIHSWIMEGPNKALAGVASKNIPWPDICSSSSMLHYG